MAYEQTDALKRKIEQLSTPVFSGGGAGLANAIRMRRAGKYEKQLTAAEERNQANQAQELAMLLKGAETGRVGPTLVSAQMQDFNPTDPTVRELAAKLRLDKATKANEEYTLSPGTRRYRGSEMVAENPATTVGGSMSDLQYYMALPAEERADAMRFRRNPYLNAGSEFVDTTQTSGNIARTPTPGEMPELRGQQAAAVEAAQTAAIPARVNAQTAAEREVNRPQAERGLQQQQAKAGFLEDLIDQAASAASAYTTGMGGNILAKVPGSPAYDLGKTIDTIKANIGFDQLQAMRDASPTGGALGQVAVQEINYLQALLGNLEQSQSEPQFRQNLENVRQGIRRVVHGSEEQFGKMYGESSNQPARNVIEEADAILKRSGF